jgi:3-methyladenine DNA glycosylase/8-oxoguanine DNA glycosylase
MNGIFERFELKVKKPYTFAQSVQDYGWIALAPCKWLKEADVFQRMERLDTGQAVRIQVSEGLSGVSSDGQVAIQANVEAARPFTKAQGKELTEKLRWMLRLDEEFEPFYERAAEAPRLWSEIKAGRGRLLRSPTLFEDVVKTICTTNTTWRQTVGMVDRLVHLVGDPYSPDPNFHAFPTPEQIAAADLELLQQEVRLGYRSAYVHQLAQEIVAGDRELESLRFNQLPAAELKKQLLSIKGVGKYAANTLLMLLGRYGELAVDSEMRTSVSERYFNGQSPGDKEIQSIYEGWGEWKYLAYWFDLIA